MKHLNWFLGPKGENADFLIESVLIILQDYIHWRRNYFPNDTILIDKKSQRENQDEYDKIHKGLMEMISKLRRNFPFYSPRYIGHMLSDISIPATLGYVAGMLHNSNNCTTEAAPVTVEWEIEACNNILEMIGFTPSPLPPSKEAKNEEFDKYESKLKKEFGWAHITSGGTVANIEALWVARTIKYYPLAIQDVAIRENLEIEIKLPRYSENNPVTQDIKQISKKDLLFIKSNESIYLYSRFIEALKREKEISITDANDLSSELLKKSKYSLGNNVGNIFSEFPPVIFVSGTAHYSINKAADLLGIGSKNVVLVNTDPDFRLDTKDLKRKIDKTINEGKIPLAVIAIAGTTEEGAVDPIHEVVELRNQYEEDNKSFWLHIDSAWGGYITSLFTLDEEDQINLILDKILNKISEKKKDEFEISSIKEKMDLITSKLLEKILLLKEEQNEKLRNYQSELKALISNINNITSKQFISRLKYISLGLDTNNIPFLKKEDFILNLKDRCNLVTEFVKDEINFSLNNKIIRKKVISWGGKPIIRPFLSFKNADSITIDPHKLGYVPYPCGVIAFRNDRVRHFIMQRAPYITSSKHNALRHNPPQHFKNIDNIDNIDIDNDVEIDAFAPFILEGSKPGAAASALWFSSKMIPLNRKNHGLILKESIISARELYEWINNWENIYNGSGRQEKLQYQFKTFGSMPDINVFIFTIKSNLNDTIKGLNMLTNKIYQKYSILLEQGSRKHSYSQSFFLSKTDMYEEHYKFDVFKEHFKRWEIDMRNAEKEYKKDGLTVLRATVMNPYIATIRRNTNQNLLKDFVIELHKYANEYSVKLFPPEPEA